MTQEYDIFGGPPTEPEETEEQPNIIQQSPYSVEPLVSVTPPQYRFRNNSEVLMSLNSPSGIGIDLSNLSGSVGRIQPLNEQTISEQITRQMSEIDTFIGTTTDEPVRYSQGITIDSLMNMYTHTPEITPVEITEEEIRAHHITSEDLSSTRVISGNFDIDGSLFADYMKSIEEEQERKRVEMQERKRRSKEFFSDDSLNGTYHSIKLFTIDGVHGTLPFSGNSSYHIDAYKSHYKTMSHTLIPTLDAKIPDVMSIISNTTMLRGLQHRYDKNFYLHSPHINAEIFDACPICAEKMHHEHHTKTVVPPFSYRPHQWNEKKPAYFNRPKPKQKLDWIKYTTRKMRYIDSYCLNTGCNFHSIQYKEGFSMSQLNQFDLYKEFFSILAYSNLKYLNPYPNRDLSLQMYYDSNSERKLLEYTPMFHEDFKKFLPNSITIPRSIM